LIITRRRVVRWRREWNRGKGLGNLKPGPTEPLHKLLPVERESVLQMTTNYQNSSTIPRGLFRSR
jgi:hypothetical protein